MRKFIYGLLLLLFLASPAYCADRYFVAGGVDNDWSGTDNWSTSTGGAGGETVPTSSDAVYLDGNSPLCNIDATANCLSIDCTGYTNTLTIEAAQTLNVYGSLTFVAGMTFTHNDETVQFLGTGTVTTAGKEFGGVKFNLLTETVTLADNLTTTALLTWNANSTNVQTLTGQTINVQGDITFPGGSGAVIRGTTALKITGTAAQTFTGGGVSGRACNLPLEIDKASNTVTFTGTFFHGSSWTYTSGTVDTTTNTATITFQRDFGGFAGPFVVTNSTMTFYNVTMFLQSTTMTLVDDMTVNNLLQFANTTTNTQTLNGNTINIKKDLTFLNDQVINGTTVLEFNAASGTQILTGADETNPYARECKLPVTINTGGTLNLVGAHGFEGTWTYTTGTVNAGTSHIFFNPATVNCDGITFYDVSFHHSVGSSVLSSPLQVSNSVNILASATLNANGQQITCSGNWSCLGTLTANSNVVVFNKSSGTATIDGSAAFYDLTCQIAGLTLEFDNTGTQSVTNILTLEGSGVSDLILVSDSPTDAWGLTWTGATSSIKNVNVTDSDASDGYTIDASDGTNTEGINNTNWMFTKNVGRRIIMML